MKVLKYLEICFVSAGGKQLIYLRRRLQPLLRILRSLCWHEKDKINEMMPLAYKNSFKNVQSIIDCFELFIEKPKDAIKQSTSYSSYKVRNGIK